MTRDWYEFTEYEAPDGEVYRFDTETKFLMSETGLGMPPIEYIAQRGPFQHGQTYYDYRLQPRIIQIVHRRNACSRTEWWENRANILNLLRPNRHPSGSFQLGTLKKTLTNGDVRAVDVIIEQGPMFRARDTKRWDEWGIMETLRFVAPDPTFYDPAQDTATWTPAATSSDIIFTFSFPVTFNVYWTDEDLVITYTGTWQTYPTITLTGPMSGILITNESTDETIRLNYSIANGETVTIDLPYGNKTVTSDVAGNIIGYISSDSDLATFHIAPAPEVSGGTNTINFQASDITLGTSLAVLSYYTRYIGI